MYLSIIRIVFEQIYIYLFGFDGVTFKAQLS